MFDNIDIFLDQILKEINETGIDTTDLKMDHIAYSTKSSQEYEEILPKMVENGKLEKEAIISERRVAVIKLNAPIAYKDQLIEVVELLESKTGQNALSGWEHVEFLVEDYNHLLSKYPTMSWNKDNMNRKQFSRLKITLPSGREVKFLNTPVLVSIRQEII